MNNTQLNQALCAVITTIAETGAAPESILYLGLGCSLDDWHQIKAVMQIGKIIDEPTPNLLTLTDKGRELAAKINARLAQARA